MSDFETAYNTRLLDYYLNAANLLQSFRKYTRQHPLWQTFPNVMSAQAFRDHCMENREAPNLEPGVPLLWCVILATLSGINMSGSGDYDDIEKWHLDLKNVSLAGKPNNAKPYDIFISHSRPDNSPTNDDTPNFNNPDALPVTKMAQLMAQGGNPPTYLGSDHLLADWLNETNGGRQARYERMMQPLIWAANHFVLVLSPEYLNSPVCQWEMETILTHVATNNVGKDSSAPDYKKVVVVERRRVVDKKQLLAKIQKAAENGAAENEATALGENLPDLLWETHDAWIPFWYHDPEITDLQAPDDVRFPPLPSGGAAFQKVVPDINRAIRAGKKIGSVYVAETVPELEAERQKLMRQMSEVCSPVPVKNINPVNYRANVDKVIKNSANLMRGVVLARAAAIGEETVTAFLSQQTDALKNEGKAWTVWTDKNLTPELGRPSPYMEAIFTQADVWKGSRIAEFANHVIKQMMESPPVAPAPPTMPLDIVIFHDSTNEDSTKASDLEKFIREETPEVVYGQITLLTPNGSMDEWRREVKKALKTCRRLLGVYVPSSDGADSVEWIVQKMQELQDGLQTILDEKRNRNTVGLRLCVLPPPETTGLGQVRAGNQVLEVLNYAPDITNLPPAIKQILVDATRNALN